MVAADKALDESERTVPKAGRARSQMAVIVGLRATLTTWQEISAEPNDNHQRP